MVNRHIVQITCALACTIAFPLSGFADSIPLSGFADSIKASGSAGTVTTDVKGDNKLTSGNPISVAGTWNLTARAFDTKGTHPPVKKNSGAYTKTDGSGDNTKNSDAGKVFTADSEAYISWDGTKWASNGSGALTSSANVALIKGADTSVTESASALATVLDPRDFMVTFDPNDQSPFLVFSLTMQAGAELGTITGQGLTGDASMSGNYQTSLLSSDLWDFSWSVDSANPNNTTFQFQSNPVLGLNDAAIQAGFQSLVSGSLGQFTLAQDFVVTADLPVTLPPDSNVLTFTTGGEVDFGADAATVPEPGCGLLVASAMLLIGLGMRMRLICAS
jgi:hypothetical protein